MANRSPLTRSGFDNRSSGRLVKANPKNPLHRMRQYVVFNHETGQHEEKTCDTSGKTGMLSKVKRGVPGMILKVGTKSTPGKSKAKPRKSRGGLCARINDSEHVIADGKMRKRKIKAWLRLHDSHIKFLYDQKKFRFSKHNGKLMDTLESIIHTRWPEHYKEMLRTAEQRKKSLVGMLRKNQLKGKPHVV